MQAAIIPGRTRCMWLETPSNPTWVVTDIALGRETEGNRLAGYRRDARSDTPSTPSYRYFPSSGGSITYNKTALWLNTMERWLGWPALQRILSTHFSRSAFTLPTPADFVATANAVSGRDLGGFFDQVYRSSNVFDYGVQDIRSERDGEQYRATVVARRYGEATFPVDLLVTFAGGERVTEHWDGQERWKLYVYDRRAPIVSAQIDPNRVLLLDVNYTNNSKTMEPQGAKAATKWSMTWMLWLQDGLLSWLALA